MADRFGRTPAQINADMATIARLSGYDQADPSNYSDALRQNAARMGMTPSEYVSWSRSQGSIQAAPAGPQLREKAWQGAARREGTQFADRVVGRPYRAEGGSLSLLDFAGGGALDLVDAVSRGRDASLGDAAMAALGAAETAGAPLALSGARKAVAGAAAEVPSTKLTRSLREGLLDTPTLPAPRNEAEAMAKRILEMRAAGRAEDVTEQMMAAADPQYMFFNTPLPMDYESRMARRNAMYGKDRYHGTNMDFEGFSGNVFTSDNPTVASTYNRGMLDAQIYPVVTREGPMGEVTVEGGLSNWNQLRPDMIDDPAIARELDRGMPISTRDIERQAAFEGRSGVTFRDINDLGPGFNSQQFKNIGYTPEEAEALRLKYIEELSAPSEVDVRLSPNLVRSRFARFDPAFRHLRNLSAGVGGAGLLSYGYPSEGY